MLLVPLEQRLGAGHVLGEVVGGDERADVAHPRDEVAVVGQEAVQRVRRLQLRATFLLTDYNVRIYVLNIETIVQLTVGAQYVFNDNRALGTATWADSN